MGGWCRWCLEIWVAELLNEIRQDGGVDGAGVVTDGLGP